MPTSHGFVPVNNNNKKKKKVQIANPLAPTAARKSAFVQLFEFTGTLDYSAYLCVPDAIAYRREVCGGEEAVMRYCIDLAQRGCRRVADILHTDILGGDDQEEEEGQWQREIPMGMVRLPLDEHISQMESDEQKTRAGQWVEKEGLHTHGFFAPVVLHGHSLFVRLSAQVYLTIHDFETVGYGLLAVCKKFRPLEVSD